MFKDLSGQRFGRLVVLGLSEKRKVKGGTVCYYTCRCDCGNTKNIKGSSLKSGVTISCGCYGKEARLIKNTKHGFSAHPLKGVRDGIIGRTCNPSHTSYPNYGGRGIKVCDEWKNNPKSFYEWALANGYRKGLQIDRIDNNGDYCPENCQWVTRVENNRNKRDNRYIEYQGITYTFSELVRKFGVSHSTLWYRISRGWSLEKALTASTRTRRRKAV